MLNIRKSRVLRLLREGKVATSIKLNLADARAAEIAAMCGFDCLWTDMEHTANDYAAVENIIRSAKIYDADVIVRVSKGSYSNYIRPLELDAAAIMIPHLMSLKEAEEIVYYTKFYPMGRRPLDGGNADGNYCLTGADEYMQQANEQRFIAVQVEDPEVLGELDKICALPGIDMIFFGPADFSQGIGAPNDFSNPQIDRVRRTVAQTARKYGKIAGTVGSPANQDELIDMGYQFINLGADVIALSAYYSDITKKCIGKKQKTAK